MRRGIMRFRRSGRDRCSDGTSGIGKTQIMEQIARELGVGLVAYTITHHTKTERRRTAVHPGGGIRGEDLLCDGAHDE